MTTTLPTLHRLQYLWHIYISLNLSRRCVETTRGRRMWEWQLTIVDVDVTNNREAHERGDGQRSHGTNKCVRRRQNWWRLSQWVSFLNKIAYLSVHCHCCDGTGLVPIERRGDKKRNQNQDIISSVHKNIIENNDSHFLSPYIISSLPSQEEIQEWCVFIYIMSISYTICESKS